MLNLSRRVLGPDVVTIPASHSQTLSLVNDVHSDLEARYFCIAVFGGNLLKGIAHFLVAWPRHCHSLNVYQA